MKHSNTFTIYWVGQKVHLGVSITSYEKPQTFDPPDSFSYSYCPMLLPQHTPASSNVFIYCSLLDRQNSLEE